MSTRVYQVVDMPPDVTQYQAHTLKCARCGKLYHLNTALGPTCRRLRQRKW